MSDEGDGGLFGRRAIEHGNPSADETQRAFSVTEFTRRVKDALAQSIRPCWVRGEISNLRAQASGHVYFVLKDAGAQVAAVLFRGDAARQSVALRDGLQVLVFGQVSVYEARGQYQIIVRAVVEDGEGRLQREFEALKRRLAAEGLFDNARKTSIPPMPATLGFVTSPTGAAVQDFIRILKRRGWRGRLVVLPAKVQGEGAAEEMAAMLRAAETLGIFDLLVIGRGGGSLEDLWAFNEETLVRAVAACRVPVISAVGHEIDFTLCDFAADLRAETPSGAAELISSQFVHCADRMTRAAEALGKLLGERIERARGQLDSLRAHLRLLSPSARIEQGHLRLDDMAGRLASAFQHATLLKRQQLTAARSTFAARSPETRVQMASQQLLGLWKRLQAASPGSVLNRGFVIMRDDEGRPLARRAEVKAGRPMVAEFADGEVRMSATEPELGR
ncbi:exodeoxyribonuclease VII large subunit [Ereboglobus sp. PH5-5]|uniref:exodeoxyribonuclease VII large subunit n=1 Tax=Ereboglobus sp. PH5-5 TaxID=2940529 RepID=UPI002404B3AA|nr:exodeoxyribonuclease VII large subunit [Ereboglobus sp. PH5-5]MDF9832608.1 exodeoxyribonuclease VII large subunit [Ereboglobus sp. PH5-5]